MNVEIKRYPELRVGAVPHVGAYSEISEAFQRLGAIAGPAHLFERPGAAMLAIYHDDPSVTPTSQLHSDAAVVVPADVALPDGLIEERVPAGDYASATVIGPYDQLPGAWAQFMGEWLPSSGRRMGRGVSCEIYHNDPGTTPKERLETEIRIPLAPE